MSRLITFVVLIFWLLVVHAESTDFVDIDRISISKAGGTIYINTKQELSKTSTTTCIADKYLVKIEKGTTLDTREAIQKQYSLILLAKTLERKIRFSGSCDSTNAIFLATYITME